MFLAGEAEAARRIQAATSDATHLDLSFLELRQLPGSLQVFSNLTWLHLGGNQLTEIPDWLGDLNNLTWLSIGGNQLSEIPGSLGQLTKLTWLSIGGNQVRVLPDSLSQLTNLTTLHLGGNQLRVLPEWLSQLIKLTILGLSDNQLRVLPDSLSQLTNLTWLHLGGNPLTVLPDSLVQLTNLTWLSVGDSQLRVLPYWLAQLPNLSTLHLYHNPLVSPPPEVVTQGIGAVMTFLKAQVRTGTGRQWRAKLMVVGEGGVGKTSLLKALTGQPHDVKEPTTHGLRIEEVAISHPLERDKVMRLSAWDFGGQEIYHATHQFFLSAGCLAILVWNSRMGHEQGRLYYWLKLLHSRAPGTPILLVATHTADRAADLPIDTLRQDFPQIIASLSVECPSGDGIEAVQTELANRAAKLDVMGAPWPSSWLAAIEACRAISYTHVERRKFFHILADTGIIDPAERGTLARVMHRLGDILYFPEDQQLADIVILRPQWLNTCIAAILDSKKVAERHGLVTRADLEQEWGRIERAVRDHLLDLMERFDIGYRITGTGDDAVAIVVDRLPHNPPEDYIIDWAALKGQASAAEMRVRYQLGAMLPPGVPTWFIAREHRFATGKAWRTGALLKHDDDQHLGLVVANQTNGTVDLTVRGPWPASFLWTLDSGLNLTFARYPGLKIVRLIPCPCKDCAGQANPTWYDYVELTRRLDASIYTIECGKKYERVDIPSLLSGIAPNSADMDRSRDDHYLELLNALDSHTMRILTAVELGSRTTASDLAQQSAAMDVGFTRIWNLLDARYQSRCPRVFTLIPAGGRRFPGAHYYIVRLYCEEPGAWHPLPGEEGTYRVTHLDNWLAAISRHLTRILALLAAAAPLTGSILGIAAAQLQGRLADDVTQMKELLTSLPSHAPIPAGQIDELTSNPASWQEPRIRAETDADYRAIAHFLRGLDDAERWGGLSRVNTPEGRILYVCPYHFGRYRVAASGPAGRD